MPYMLTWNETLTNTAQFAERWQGSSKENAQAQTFWKLSLAEYGVDCAAWPMQAMGEGGRKTSAQRLSVLLAEYAQLVPTLPSQAPPAKVRRTRKADAQP
ncbi:hypothetical protein HLB42_21365 (plasmid) [Deinococcus sp. D7000]|nr:hypothetical protein HLB42_21365 [Deinococcus sp. D7000]